MSYSYQTSLPAYHQNQSGKELQKERVLQFIKNGINNLKQLQQNTGLQQSTIAGRVNDLIADKKVMYQGTIIYQERLRKKIIVVPEYKPQTLFN